MVHSRERLSVNVRAVEASDRDAFVALYRSSFPPAARRPLEEVERKLSQLFIDGPLCSTELPSLVACDGEGALVGFRGSLARRWRLGDEQLPGRCTTGINIRDDVRRMGVGHAIQTVAREMRARQPQETMGFSDRSTSDGRAFFDGVRRANSDAHRLEQFGYTWEIPLRRLAIPRARRLGRRLRLSEGAAQRFACGLAALLPRRPLELDDVAELPSAPLSAAALAETFDALSDDFPLRLDESIDTWRWLFDYLKDYPSRGVFSGRVWLAQGGRPLGFYSAYLNDIRRLEVVAFGVLRDHLASAIVQILRDAASLGANSVIGWASARELRTIMDCGGEVQGGTRAGVNTRRQDLRLYFESMEALFSGLEGERWL
jgi:hypothetical protein